MKILDVCCGGRMMWFDKNHKDAVYCDFSIRPPGCISQQPGFSVIPNVVSDFRNLPFADESFNMVVFDPPHITDVDLFSIMGKKYGSIDSNTWENDLSTGFSECWRVLKQSGTIIFKWAESRIKVSDVLKCFDHNPLFGHTTGKSGGTKWMCFVKC